MTVPKFPELRVFDREQTERFAQKIASYGAKGTFICEDGCLRDDGKPRSWQSKGEADFHQQKTGHRILLNPNLRVEELPPEVRRVMERQPGAHGELDLTHPSSSHSPSGESEGGQ